MVLISVCSVTRLRNGTPPPPKKNPKQVVINFKCKNTVSSVIYIPRELTHSGLCGPTWRCPTARESITNSNTHAHTSSPESGVGMWFSEAHERVVPGFQRSEDGVSVNGRPLTEHRPPANAVERHLKWVLFEKLKKKPKNQKINKWQDRRGARTSADV